MGRTFLITVLTLAAGIAACWPAVRPVAQNWQGTMLSHTYGYIIDAVSVWLIWQARREIDAEHAAPSWTFVVITAFMSFAWYVAWISGLEAAFQLVVPVILFTAVAGAVGLRAARLSGFAIAFLYFGIPLWSWLTAYLQSLSSLGVTALARITGVPAYVAGNMVHIPSGSFEITGGCSGINYFVVALAIAALYGELNRNRLRGRVLLILAAAMMAILMNWVRIYGIILDAHATDMTGYLVREHLTYGWVLFGILLAAFFWIAPRLAPIAASKATTPPPSDHAAANLSVALVAVAAALAVGPSLTALAEARTDDSVQSVLTLPNGLEDWQGPMPAVPGWMPVYQQADAEAHGEYARAGLRVAAYVNAYDYQTQGHELVGYGNSVLGSADWREDRRRRAMARAQSGDIPYVEVEVTATDQQRWLVGYFYSVGRKYLTGPIASKLYYGIAALEGRPRTGVVAVASRCVPNCAAASVILNEFLLTNGHALAGTIQQPHGAT